MYKSPEIDERSMQMLLHILKLFNVMLITQRYKQALQHIYVSCKKPYYLVKQVRLFRYETMIHIGFECM